MFITNTKNPKCPKGHKIIKKWGSHGSPDHYYCLTCGKSYTKISKKNPSLPWHQHRATELYTGKYANMWKSGNERIKGYVEGRQDENMRDINEMTGVKTNPIPRLSFNPF